MEKQLAEFVGVKYCSTVNSGSSANLLAFSALTSHLLPKDQRIEPGSEVISVAASFPTTVNPIIQYGAIPVFLDVDLETYNIKTDLLEEAITEKTRAIFLAHSLGNPFNLEAVMRAVNDHNLWLIEDNCDSLGAEYNGQKTGSFGHIGTQSFYPAHHINYSGRWSGIYQRFNFKTRTTLHSRLGSRLLVSNRNG